MSDNTNQTNCLSEKFFFPADVSTQAMNTAQNFYEGFTKYMNGFLDPYLMAANYFSNVESIRLLTTSPLDSFRSYMELLEFNTDLALRSLNSTMGVIGSYQVKEGKNILEALGNTLLNREGENICTYLARQSRVADMIAKGYPQAIQAIEPQFGFHFERGRDIKVAETDRFIVYQIMPTKEGIETNPKGKPILILPPYVLGADILAFLPGENRSYTHYFANMGIPTYIRIMKNIHATPALQVMTAEDDARDTRFFCEKIIERNEKAVTLNGYCQGGYMAVCNLLSGELDGVVDALITCVAPMDGTRSKGLAQFLSDLPDRFNHLMYGTKTLPNGNKVADGDLMGWIYKLKSIENEFPTVAFFRDMTMLSMQQNGGKKAKISNSAAAINYWLQNERTDLPLSITRMSFASYNIPVTKNGVLPVKMFGKELNFKRIPEKGIKWLICYGEKDDLVEPEVALAPLDYVDAEISPFPKGHVAIATSWSDPRSACALHMCFGEKNYRGPVRFQLDLDEEKT